jgi:hypothetical protein
MSKKVKKPRFPKKSICNGLNKDGSEVCDSKPTELRAAMAAPVTMKQKMRALWKEFRVKEQEAGEYESMADAQDFDVSNDDFPSSPYESEVDLADVLESAVSAANNDIQADGGAEGNNEVIHKEVNNDVNKGE